MTAPASAGDVSGWPDRAPFMVEIARPGDGRAGCVVLEPARLLRMWSVLAGADGELHRRALPAGALPRWQRLFDQIRLELGRSVSPPLAAEMFSVTGRGGAQSMDELRIEYASLLGWAGGLVLAMLSQLEAAAERQARGESGPLRPTAVQASAGAPAARQEHGRS